MTSSSGHPTLPSGALAAWHRALQSHSLAALTTLVLLAVIVVATIAMDQAPGNAAEVVESAPWLAGSAVQGLGLGALVSVWFAPALGVWLGAAALLAAPFADTFVSSTVGLGAALLLVGLGLADVAGRRRQRLASQQWSTSPVMLPESDPAERGHAERWRTGWTALGGILLVAALVLIAVFARDLAAVKAFRAHAEVTVGTVVEVADDEMSAVVDVGGLRLDVPLPTVYVDVDEQVGVRHDDTGRAELVNDADDPSWSLLLSVAALAAGLTLLVKERGRRRAVRRLLTFGGPAVRLLATTDGSWGVQLADPQAPAVVVATSGRLLNLRPFEPAEGVDADPEWERPVTEVADAALLRLARERLAEALAAEDPTTPPLGAGSLSTPDGWRDVAVDVVGLVEHGEPVALRGPDGAWWVTEVGVRGPDDWLRRLGKRIRGQAAPVLGGEPAGQDPDPDLDLGLGEDRETFDLSSSATSSDAARPPLFVRFARRTGPVGPWLAAFAAPAAAWWLDLDVIGTLVLAFTIASALHAWSGLALAPLKITRDRFVSRQAVLDEHYPWARVRDVVADDKALVIRLHASEVEPEDALLFATPPGVPLLRGVTDPHEARRLLLAARDAALPRALTDTRTRRLPSTPAIVTTLFAAGWLAGSFLG